ncbi:ATP synthase F1 subunit gamma [Roseivirga pacifica]|uniref:ATP synthase F1 subunit gamma n=1 Tax=Roseivirga pacifica TaxID=1267423 RepID=UPI002094EECA|nr:ATP synthase F1 subunit gamma [Roseivirga pacifica]MCO6359394.1 ATP synthase F1 subunit gamma [Roseivirga pacifica]MCO6366764.1 ATP synthase F1 subunit gamma [Roseivirga pacifica]MCO6370704.1 ATP synthase F1 subunit gamma [Roseivirga pacifica]MCO6374420.1 ATP synthase F1 subunit gamma [Roseivirga pacifica]MCO6379679.1 ATP synthase F1 subunit gamma [Roseivirga pacifica]
MASLKEVKERIKSVSSTQQITKAMKMVAAAKLRRAQDRTVQLRPYSEKLSALLANVSSGNSDAGFDTYAVEREVKKVLIVPVTSDRGLCGAFNTNIFKAVRAMMQTNNLSDGDVEILPIGRKSYDFFRKKGFTVIDNYYEVFGDLTFDNVREAAEFAMEGFVNENYDRVVLVYNEFKNVATQIVRTEQFLPIQEIAPEAGEATTNTDYIYEPSKTFIIEELIPKSLKIQFYKAVLESNASEHGARMTAMGKATDNAGELLKELKLTYNRTRQAAITKEILEIVGGAEALASS